MKMLGLCGVLAATWLTAPAGAAVIDFEGIQGCGCGNGFRLGGVTFAAAESDFFSIRDFGTQGDGQSLYVDGDNDGNYLIGTLDQTAQSMSLAFGNDDPFYTDPGDLATLRLFRGVDEVGSATVVMNRDDLMNQSISFSGALFDRFTFAYTDPTGYPVTGALGGRKGLAELVDNIDVTYAAAVPEPATWALMILGFGAAGAALRWRRPGTAWPPACDRRAHPTGA
jgi:hypothetical protein